MALSLRSAPLEIDLHQFPIRRRWLLRRLQQPSRQFREVNQAFDQRQHAPHGSAVQNQATEDQQGMWNGGGAAGAYIDIAYAPGDVGAAHVADRLGVPDLLERLFADIADWPSIQHVALATRINVAVVLDVKRAAPEIVARVLPVLRGVPGFR